MVQEHLCAYGRGMRVHTGHLVALVTWSTLDSSYEPTAQLAFV